MKHILRQLDVALKNIRITVKQGTQLRLNEKERSVAAEIHAGGNGRVVIGGIESQKDVVDNDLSDGTPRVLLLDKKQELDGIDTQTVVTIEGRPA